MLMYALKLILDLSLAFITSIENIVLYLFVEILQFTALAPTHVTSPLYRVFIQGYMIFWALTAALLLASFLWGLWNIQRYHLSGIGVQDDLRQLIGRLVYTVLLILFGWIMIQTLLMVNNSIVDSIHAWVSSQLLSAVSGQQLVQAYKSIPKSSVSYAFGSLISSAVVTFATIYVAPLIVEIIILVVIVFIIWAVVLWLGRQFELLFWMALWSPAAALSLADPRRKYFEYVKNQLVGVIFTQAMMAIAIYLVLWMHTQLNTNAFSLPDSFMSGLVNLALVAAGFWFVTRIPRFWQELNGHSSSGGHEMAALAGGYMMGRFGSALVGMTKLGQKLGGAMDHRRELNANALWNQDAKYAGQQGATDRLRAENRQHRTTADYYAGATGATMAAQATENAAWTRTAQDHPRGAAAAGGFPGSSSGGGSDPRGPNGGGGAGGQPSPDFTAGLPVPTTGFLPPDFYGGSGSKPLRSVSASPSPANLSDLSVTTAQAAADEVAAGVGSAVLAGGVDGVGQFVAQGPFSLYRSPTNPSDVSSVKPPRKPPRSERGAWDNIGGASTITSWLTDSTAAGAAADAVSSVGTGGPAWVMPPNGPISAFDPAHPQVDATPVTFLPPGGPSTGWTAQDAPFGAPGLDNAAANTALPYLPPPQSLQRTAAWTMPADPGMAAYFGQQQQYISQFASEMMAPVMLAAQKRHVPATVKNALSQQYLAHTQAASTPEATAQFMAEQLGYVQAQTVTTPQGSQIIYQGRPDLMMTDPAFAQRWQQYVDQGVAPPIDTQWAQTHLDPAAYAYATSAAPQHIDAANEIPGQATTGTIESITDGGGLAAQQFLGDRPITLINPSSTTGRQTQPVYNRFENVQVAAAGARIQAAGSRYAGTHDTQARQIVTDTAPERRTLTTGRTHRKNAFFTPITPGTRPVLTGKRGHSKIDAYVQKTVTVPPTRPTQPSSGPENTYYNTDPGKYAPKSSNSSGSWGSGTQWADENADYDGDTL